MSSSTDIVLSTAEIEALTGYEQATKQLRVLRDRGFTRAFISSNTGKVILERAHYEAVCCGTVQQTGQSKRANLSFLKAA